MPKTITPIIHSPNFGMSILNYIHEHVLYLNNSKFFAGIIMILLNVGSKFISIQFSKSTEEYLKFSLSKHYESGDIEKLVKVSLVNLNVKSIFGVLLHNFNDYKSNPELWKEMLRLRSLGVIENIGFSIYYPEELDFVLKSKVDFDIIQIPFNVFDRRFKRFFSELDSRNILIYFRSIFMQGLVFLDPGFINQKLDLAKKYIQSLRSISFDSGIHINSLCLNYALSQNSTYKIIIGVTTSAELKKNISLINEFNKSHEVFERLDNLNITDNELDIIIRQLIEIQVEKINNKQ